MAGLADRHASTPAELQARLAAERAGLPFLRFRDEHRRQVIVVLDTAAARTIGRRAENDVALPWDSEVSRVHAQLEPVGGDWALIDDGLSRNGSYVNGERVSGRRRLRDGDRLCFGETPVEFRAPAHEASSSTAVVGVSSGAPIVLSETQRRILVALCRPLRDTAYALPATNKAIGAEVGLSVDAVKSHLRVLFSAAQLDGAAQNEKRARLAAYALVNGLVRQHDL
jgi:pSer/pThr/pTyr-binding forkhead associated (FHA) protein